MRALLLVFAALASGAQQDPLPAAKALEIAKAQRDWISAKAQYDAATARVQGLMQDATAACKAADKTFDASTITCEVTKPQPPTGK